MFDKIKGFFNEADFYNRKTTLHTILGYCFIAPYNLGRMLLSDFWDFLKENQVVKVIIGIASLVTFYFLIQNRRSVLDSEIKIKESTLHTGGGEFFTGLDLDFAIINQTTTLSIINKQPEIWVKYNYNNWYRTKKENISDKVIIVTEKTYPITLTSRKSKEYFKIRIGIETVGYLEKKMKDRDIQRVSLFLRFQNDVNKKYKVTKNHELGKGLFLYRNNPTFRVDTIINIIKKMEG